MEGIVKTGTGNDQSNELMSLGLSEETCDTQVTVKLLEATGTRVVTLKSWSLAKLISLIPCDSEHKFGITGREGEKCRATASSVKDKYRKTVNADNYVDAVYEIVVYLIKKGIIKKG